MENIEEKLRQGAAELGVELNEEALARFALYTRELTEWNQKINLTAITEPEEIAVKHYLDSLSILRFQPVKAGQKLADIGCGAGFPGIPLKIACPALSLTCIDSLGKRVTFLAQLLAKLGFADTACLHARAEEAGRDPALREQFDFATARAVARLHVLAEYCLPFVRAGGLFIAMKGPDAQEEEAEAKRAVAVLGGEIEKMETFTLPGTELRRTLFLIRKVKATPPSYPRPQGKINKKPL